MRLSVRSSALLAGAIAVLVPVGAVAQSPSPDGSVASPSPTPSLEGVSWILDSWVADGVAQPRVEGSVPSLWFSDGRLRGSTGCNPVNGTYTIDGTSLTIADLGPINAMCVQGLDAQQAAVLAGLTSAASYQLGAGTLAILDAAGAVQLTYQAAPALEGRTWVLLTPGDQPAPDQSPTLTFADGTYSGQAPCNSYSGSYTVDGSSLTLGPAVSTQMACPDLDLETAYLSTLSMVAGWSVDASGDLLLADASGNELLRFLVPNSDD